MPGMIPGHGERIGSRSLACYATAIVSAANTRKLFVKKEKHDGPLLQQIDEVSATRVRYGFWRIYVLLRRDSW